MVKKGKPHKRVFPRNNQSIKKNRIEIYSRNSDVLGRKIDDFGIATE